MPPPERLRIAFVVHDYHRYGGHSRYVVELARRFRREHEVHVFSNRIEDDDRAGIVFHRVPAWRRNALTTIATFIAPATLMVRGPFDVVHAQGLCGLRQNVITAHICQLAWFDAARCYGGSPPWRKRVFEWMTTSLDRLVMRPEGASAFIAPSERIRDDMAAKYGLAETVHVIPHGTDTELFHPRNRDRWRVPIRHELGIAETAPVALYVGDLQKAMPAALRALAKAPDVTLLTVSRSMVAPYQELAEELGVAHRVRFAPATAHVERYYAATDVFLFPTFYDSFGMVVSEAMASGLPVITSRAAGASQFIDHRVSGWLTRDPWNEDELAEGINALVGDLQRRERMGMEARKAVESHTWDRVAEATMGVYRDVVARRRR